MAQTNKFTTLFATAATLLAVLVTAGCGGSSGAGSGAGSSGSSPATSAPNPSATTVDPSQMTDQQQPPNRLVIDVTIKGGDVTPTNAQLQGKVGEPIVVRVNSDAADELHVHSVPDHKFTIEAKPGQTFQFTVDVPGQVEVELHHLTRTIATIQVQQ
jgi:hypothetical protein